MPQKYYKIKQIGVLLEIRSEMNIFVVTNADMVFMDMYGAAFIHKNELQDILHHIERFYL